MKTFWVLCCCCAAALAVSAADLVPVNGSFDAWKGNSPDGFTINTIYKNWTAEKRSGGAHDGQNYLHVSTGTAPRSAFGMMGGFVAAYGGNKVTLSCAVRGKGAFRFEIYCYNARGQWVGQNVHSPKYDVDTDQWLEEKFQVDLPVIKDPKRGSIGRIRAVLFVMQGSTLDFDAFSGVVGATDASVKTPAPAAVASPAKPAAGYPVAAIEPRAPLGAVYLPPRLYAVPGQELNIYFDNLSVLPMPGAVEVVSSVGVHMQDCFRFVPKPEQTGTHPLRLEWRDAAGNLLASAETEIVVSSAKPAPRKLKLLVVGDSLTNGSTYVRRMAEALRQDGVEVSFIGSHAGNGKPAQADGVVHEGYGGWQFSTFLSRWTDGTDFRARSPFLTGPGKLDIPAYFEKMGGVPDVITVLLGVNDIASCTRKTLPERLPRVCDNADKLLAALAQAAPNAKIGVGLIPPPAASQDAFGYNYRTWINRTQYLRNVFALWQEMEKKYRNHPRYELVPVCVNIDCKNNYPARKTPYNAHNKETFMMQNNAVHPAAAGYRQIGDSFYFWMRSFLR